MSGVERTLAYAAAVTAARRSGGEEGSFRGVAIDSRAIRGGELFVALRGERVDGHDYVADALARGAAGALVEREVARDASRPEAPLLVVADTLAALHALTRQVRAERAGRIVGVTGSTGKTTTKDLLAAMLSRRYAVAKTPGNLNNLLGFPLTLLNADENAQWLVAEMGISTPGEMVSLARLVRPNAAVITNVREAHLEFFASRRAIAEEKGRILEALEEPRLFVANAADPEVERLARGFAGPVVRFAVGSEGPTEVDVRAAAIHFDAAGAARFRVRAGGEEAEFRLRLLGEHNVENATGAAAAAIALGVPLAAAAAAAEEVVAAPHRGVLRRVGVGAGSALVIDDCYNSNPSALDRALEATVRLPGRRHWVVLGDMRELGSESADLHRAAGVKAARLGFRPIAAVGSLAQALAAGAGEDAIWFPDAVAAARWAPGELRADDVVLVKGSRGVGLEVVADALAGERRADDRTLDAGEGR